MKKNSTAEVNANYLANLFEERDNELLEKEKATKKKAKKKADTVEKAEITEKAEKPKTVKKATKKATEKVENSEKSQSTKKVVKAVEKTTEKEPKKTTKKAKAETVEPEAKEQELRPLDSIKIAKTEYIKCESVKTYEDLVKMVEDEEEVFVAFDISEVEHKEYENIFHVPFEKSMKEKFDICTPIFVGEKNPRLVFASVYTEALWDLFPDEFELLSTVLIEKPKKAKK